MNAIRSLSLGHARSTAGRIVPATTSRSYALEVVTPELEEHVAEALAGGRRALLGQMTADLHRLSSSCGRSTILQG
jgi:hypothetical protein